MITFGERYVEAAARYVGAPYIWAAKGKFRIDQASGKLVSLPEDAFDCSGLVTTCLREVGGADHRLDWNAQTMFNVLDKFTIGSLGPCLAFFGNDEQSIHHVGIALDGALGISGWFLEAAGGDSTTLEPKDGARVYLHRVAFYPSSMCRGYRSIPSVLVPTT